MRPREFTLLCQRDWGGREERLARQVALIEDIEVLGAGLEGIDRYAAQLAGGTCVPIGTVEFVRRAMGIAGISEPANLSYPQSLEAHLHRRIERISAGVVMGRWFVKPAVTKAFTGFVFDTFADPADLDAHARAQCEAFLALDPDAPVWVGEVVSWASEVRYYVLDGRIVGEGRYDDGPEDALLPGRSFVCEMVRRFCASPEAPVAFAIDAGVLDCGTTALVEVNDAWALGFYSGTLNPREHVRMLWRRWQQLAARTDEARHDHADDR
jgi:hypothetical protein